MTSATKLVAIPKFGNSWEIMRMSAEYHVLEAEKSSELVAALRLLSETVDSGQPRFSPECCRAVARAIVCRNYASALHELCHLVRAASALRGGYVDFFWSPGPMRASLFRGIFASQLTVGSDSFIINGNGIDVIYRDKPFSVAFSRMPFLAALMEFLVTAVGFATLDDIFAPMSRPGLTSGDVSTQANTLARAMYNWLKDHLPPLQAQRKLGVLIDFLKEQNGGDFDRDSITDSTILVFWQETTVAQDLNDFRTFTSVFLAFARLRQALDNADSIRTLDQTASIGSARDDGEVNPHEINSFIDTVSEDGNPLNGLAEAPASRIKFLNAKEQNLCRFLFECGRVADQLPLSFVRSEVFGSAQSRVTQGLRTGTSGKALADLIDASCSTDYRSYQDALASLTAHGRSVLLASAHIMRTAGVVTITAGPNVVSFRRESTSGPSMTMSEANTFLEDARGAAKGICRQGFRPADLADDEVKDGFVMGVPLVAKITERIEAFLELLDRLRLPSDDWDAQFCLDKLAFTACFRTIYGVQT